MILRKGFQIASGWMALSANEEIVERASANHSLASKFQFETLYQPTPTPTRAVPPKRVNTKPTKKIKITAQGQSKKVISSPVTSPAVSEISSRASNPGEIADLADFTIPMGEDTEVLENVTQARFQIELDGPND